MDDQVKRLQHLVDHLYRKQKVPNSKVEIECYEVFSECVLIVQKEIGIEIGNIMDKLFILIKDLLEIAQSQIKQPPEPQQIIVATQIPEFINSLQLGSVAVFNQLGSAQNIKSIQQIPWCEYKCKTTQQRSQRNFIDVGTSTVLDYYQECQKVSSQVLKKEEEMREWIEFTNDTIAMLSEALANKKQLDIEYQGKPGEIDLLISEIQFRRNNMESVLKSVNPESFGVQNFDNTVQFLQQHIHHIQQQTAIAVISRMKQKFTEKEKQTQLINDMKGKIKKKVMNKDDCRCAQYVNDLLSLKNKYEQLQNDITKKDRQILELEVMRDQKDIQNKMFQQQLYQAETEKSELKQKIDNANRELSKYVTKNSERERGYVSSSSNDEILVNTVGGHPRTTSRDQSQQQSSKQQIYLNPKENFIIQKKTQQMERLVKLVNALDTENQTRRLTQMQFILEQKASSQIHELADLIKEIEENDLLQNDQIETSQISRGGDLPTISATNLDKSRYYQNQKNSRQNSLEQEMYGDHPAIRVSIPTEQYSQKAQVSSRNMSSTSSNQKKIESSQNQNKLDSLKITNSSSNQLNPHHPFFKAKSSQNLNMSRQNSIKTQQQQQQQQQNSSQQQQKKNLKISSPKNEVEFRIGSKMFKEQYVQTEYYSKDIQVQTEKNQFQLAEQIDNLKFNREKQDTQISKNNSQQFTTNSTFHFNSAGTMGLGILNSPTLSNQNSNLPSPRNQNSNHQFLSQTGAFPTASPVTQRQKLQSLKSESEQSQIMTSQYIDQTSQKPKSWKQKVFEQQEEKHQKSSHRRMYTTATQSQTTSPRELYTARNKTKDDLMLNQMKEEQDEKQQEENMMYDQMLHEIPEQNEQDIIQKAINRTPGYELASDINENILQTMFNNLDKSPEIVEMIQKIRKVGQVNLNEFKRFVQKMQAFHKRCGRDCNHLMRFYLRLGFVSTRYLNKRKLLKLGKPKVLPGFK